MGVIDLRRLEGDQIVIHYGGALSSVDAYTFGNSLIALSDAIRGLNGLVNPGQAIEVRLEAVGSGSFRARVRKLRRGLGGFFSRAPENLFWAVFGALLLPPLLSQKEGTTTTIFDDRVEVRTGEDLIIIPREAYEQLPAAKASPDIQRNIKKTFQVIENDEAVTNFGVTPSLEDPTPLIQIPRDDFSKFSTPELNLTDPLKQRIRKERARLIVNKLWLRNVDRKWSFEWNGIPISATVKDGEFTQMVRRRQVLILSGDALDVEISFIQTYDERLAVFVNDHHTYVIEKVLGKIDQASGQEDLFPN